MGWMGWMNIVELPYIREKGNRKHHHGSYLIAKGTGVLGRIKQETGCDIKICCNEFNVATNFCDPYVWVMGDKPGEVDRAVEILQESIQNHMRGCKCGL